MRRIRALRHAAQAARDLDLGVLVHAAAFAPPKLAPAVYRGLERHDRWWDRTIWLAHALDTFSELCLAWGDHVARTEMVDEVTDCARRMRSASSPQEWLRHYAMGMGTAIVADTIIWVARDPACRTASAEAS